MYIVLAILCMVLSAIHEIIGKEIANRKIDSETMFINTYMFLGVFKIILITVTIGQAFDFRPLMLLLLVPNIIISAAVNYLYLKSLRLLPISVVVPVYLIYYPISMIFGVGFLKEQITTMQLIAIIIIFLMILIMSVNTSKSRLNKGLNSEHAEVSHKKFTLQLGDISKGLVYILTAGLLNAVLIILDKNAYNSGLRVDEMILFGGMANIIIAFIFYKITKTKYRLRLDTYKYTLTSLMLVTIGIKFLSNISYVTAMKLGNATTIIPITASNILLVAILSSYYLKEKIKKSDYACIFIFLICIIILVI